MRVVRDTNVVVSALIWSGTPYRLIQAAVDGTVTLCTSPALLAELSDVLTRPHLAARLERQSSSVEEALSLYGGLAVGVSPKDVPAVITADPDDDHVIAAAVEARAGLIVSGDRDLLDLGRHREITILAPAEAVRICCP